MANESPTASGPEHLDVLGRLNRLFGSELWKAKADTSAAAFESLRAIDTDSAKRDELEKHFLAWRERVAATIPKWVGKYFVLARSNPAAAGRAGKWVEQQVLSRLRAQCIGHGGARTFTRDGVTYLEPIEWWLRCACDGAPRLREIPWIPPDWIVPVVDSQLLYHASLTRELMSTLDAAIVNAFQVSNDAAQPSPSPEPIPRPGVSNTRNKGKVPYRSPWKIALWQAVINRGQTASYQEIANWVAEQLAETKLPKYCDDNPERDLGWLVKHDTSVRTQFKKDLNKIKADLRNAGRSAHTAADFD